MRKAWATRTKEDFGVKSPSAETRAKLSKAAKGKTISQEHRDVCRVKNSKAYTITFKDGRTETIHGLKDYSRATGIPYVTLYKASQHDTAAHKWGIASVQVEGV